MEQAETRDLLNIGLTFSYSLYTQEYSDNKRQEIRLSFTFSFSNFTLTNLSNTICRQRIIHINVKLRLKCYGDLYAICLSCFQGGNIQFHEGVCKVSGSILRNQTTLLKFVFRYPPKSLTRDYSLIIFSFLFSCGGGGYWDTPLKTTYTVNVYSPVNHHSAYYE